VTATSGAWWRRPMRVASPASPRVGPPSLSRLRKRLPPPRARASTRTFHNHVRLSRYLLPLIAHEHGEDSAPMPSARLRKGRPSARWLLAPGTSHGHDLRAAGPTVPEHLSRAVAGRRRAGGAAAGPTGATTVATTATAPTAATVATTATAATTVTATTTGTAVEAATAETKAATAATATAATTGTAATTATTATTATAGSVAEAAIVATAATVMTVGTAAGTAVSAVTFPPDRLHPEPERLPGQGSSLQDERQVKVHRVTLPHASVTLLRL